MVSSASESDSLDHQTVQHLTDLYDEHKNLLFSFILSIVGNREDAEDVVQVLFQKIWKDRARWDRVNQWRAWLLRLARNLALDHIKQSSRSRKLEELVGAEYFIHPLEEMKSEEVEEIHRALKSLDEPSRSLIMLKIFKELTFEEIGEVLQIPGSTASTRYYEAIKQLRMIYSQIKF